LKYPQTNAKKKQERRNDQQNVFCFRPAKKVLPFHPHYRIFINEGDQQETKQDPHNEKRANEKKWQGVFMYCKRLELQESDHTV
jgi:hypothetical protein